MLRIFYFLVFLFCIAANLEAKGNDRKFSEPISIDTTLSSDESSDVSSKSSSKGSSKSTSDSSSRSSSRTTSTSSLDHNSSAEIKLEPQYDPYDPKKIQEIIDSGSTYVLVATGFSESSLDARHMHEGNQVKSLRAVADSFMLANRVVTMGGRALVMYIATARINENYLHYLYYLAHRNEFAELDEQTKATQLKIEANKFIHKSFYDHYRTAKQRKKKFKTPTKDKEEEARRPYRYLVRGNNSGARRLRVPERLNRLRNNPDVPATLVGFTVHYTGPNLESMAKSWKLPYLANPSHLNFHIKKSMSRQSFEAAGVRYPKGTNVPSFGLQQLAQDIYNLLIQIDHPKIVLKLDESAGGYGNKVMKFHEEFPDLQALKDEDIDKETAVNTIYKRLKDRVIFPRKFVERIKKDGAIVEEFIVGDDFTSPATVYTIRGENNVVVEYSYDQLLGGVDGQDFKGSLGPIKPLDDESSNIILMSLKVGHHLSSLGIRGNVGTDFVIVTQNGQRVAYCIENNIRRTGTSYPRRTLEMMVGKEALEAKFMKAFDDVQVPKINFMEDRKKTFYSKLMQSYDRKDHRKQARGFRLDIEEKLFAYLRDHELSFDINKVWGCLVNHNTFALGKLGLACVADSPKEAEHIFDLFSAAIVDFITGLPDYKEFKRFYPIEVDSNKQPIPVKVPAVEEENIVPVPPPNEYDDDDLDFFDEDISKNVSNFKKRTTPSKPVTIHGYSDEDLYDEKPLDSSIKFMTTHGRAVFVN